MTAFGLYLQAVGVQVSAFALASLPYVATVVVLAVISRDQRALAPHMRRLRWASLTLACNPLKVPLHPEKNIQGAYSSK